VVTTRCLTRDGTFRPRSLLPTLCRKDGAASCSGSKTKSRQNAHPDALAADKLALAEERTGGLKERLAEMQQGRDRALRRRRMESPMRNAFAPACTARSPRRTACRDRRANVTIAPRLALDARDRLTSPEWRPWWIRLTINSASAARATISSLITILIISNPLQFWERTTRAKRTAPVSVFMQT